MVSATTTRLLKPLTLPLATGDHLIDPPVVLAPMAGITNAPFRMLCREQGAGLFVSEMVTARALIERRPETLRMIEPGKGEWPRSVQLYSVEPHTMRSAVTMLGKENLVDHIDTNFGCPVPKVTRKGGGAALPYKRNLFSAIVGAAVEAAKPFGIPVTVKMRIGIDSDHHTYLEAAKSAADLGVAWVALHARTAAQMYKVNQIGLQSHDLLNTSNQPVCLYLAMEIFGQVLTELKWCAKQVARAWLLDVDVSDARGYFQI